MIREPQLKRRLENAKIILRDSLNERFIREGEDFPFCRFPELWYNHVGKKIKPGMEIVFQDNYTWAESSHHQVQPLMENTIIDIRYSEGNDPGDSFNLKTLELTLYMIHSGATSSNPSRLIKAADAPLLNWHAAFVAPVDIQLNSDIYPISPYFIVPPNSDVTQTSFDEVLYVVFPINEINEILSILMCLTFIFMVMIKPLMMIIMQMNNS